MSVQCLCRDRLMLYLQLSIRTGAYYTSKETLGLCFTKRTIYYAHHVINVQDTMNANDN